MQHPEPQLLWLSLFQIAIQGKQLQPGNKICGNRDYVSPRRLMAH
jgi:hypothetical protein